MSEVANQDPLDNDGGADRASCLGQEEEHCGRDVS